MICKNKSIISHIAFLLWSAMLFSGCKGSAVSETFTDGATAAEMTVDSLRMRYSENGALSYYFTASRMERYTTEDSTYMLFKNGVFIETFNDSTLAVVSTLSAESALRNETLGTWRVEGNVIGKNVEDGKTLFTEKLLWNDKTEKISSDVRSTIVDGSEKMTGLNGFDADQDLSNIVFKGVIGTIVLDSLSKSPSQDSLSQNKDLSDSDLLDSESVEDYNE